MSEAVKELLVEDINQTNKNIILKQELIAEFRKIARKQTRMAIVYSVGIGLCIIMVFIAGFVYYNKTREFFFNSWRKDMELLDRREDSVRVQKEWIFRVQDTTQFFVLPMYDTIKINGNTK